MSCQFRWYLFLFAQVVFNGSFGYSQSPDVTFSTDYESGKPSTAKFNFEGHPVGEGREGFEAVIEKLRKVPSGASVVWGPDYSRCGACGGSEPRCVPKYLYPDLWEELEQIQKERGLVLSSNYPTAWPTRIQDDRCEAPIVDEPSLTSTPLRIGWSNFRGPGSSHEAVLYILNGKNVGLGDAGFDQIWKAVEKLPPNSEIVVPQYVLSGWWARESLTDAALKSHNDRLRHIVPFAERKVAFAQLVTGLRLRMTRSKHFVSSTAITEDADWGSGHNGVFSFVQVGRIVRHDEPIKQADRLEWDSGPPPKGEYQKPNIDYARYLLSGSDLGQGIKGFAAAMSRIEQLPEGSVLQVRVCLRTQAPFRCPITYEGIRHFERTGHEPFEGLLPWLVEVARARKLQLEWLPDHGVTCGDCELEGK